MAAQRYSLAGSATWNLNPTNGDWNTPTNWTPETVPNSETDVATFGQSNVTDIAVSQTVLGSLVFGSDASSYTFTLSDPTEVAYFAFYGDGVINNSPNEQTFVFPSNFLYSVNVEFRNSSTAGDRVTYYASNGGNGIFFGESANAGSATFIVNSFMDFYGAGTQTPSAANATIINDPGYTTFSFGGSAGNAFITNQHGGWTDYCSDQPSNATIINQGVETRREFTSHTSFCSSGMPGPRRSSITPRLSKEAKVVTPSTAAPIYRKVRPSLTTEARSQTLLALAKLSSLAAPATRP